RRCPSGGDRRQGLAGAAVRAGDDRRHGSAPARGGVRGAGVGPGAVNRACPACLGASLRKAFVGRDWSLGAAPGTYRYMRCVDCGTTFADPQPSDEELAAAYPAAYSNYAPEGSRLERLFEFIARREAAHVVASGPAGSPLLEIGCGSGRFLDRLRKVGWDGPLAGGEYSAAVAEAAAARLGMPIESGTAETVRL